jgi:hypothetical protein
METLWDGLHWQGIDRREGNHDPNDASYTKTFIRLRLIGPNHRGNHHFSVGVLEFFDYGIEYPG